MSDQKTPSVTIEADNYNALLIAGKVIRSVGKREFNVPVRLDLKGKKSVELVVEVLTVAGAVAGIIGGIAGTVYLIKELDAYLRKRHDRVEMKRLRNRDTKEHLTIHRTETWMEYTRRTIDREDD